MADDAQINVVVNLDIDADAADADFEKQLTDAADRAARQITNVLTAGAKQSRRGVAPEFEKIAAIIRQSIGGVAGLNRSLAAVEKSARAIEGSFGDAFDPGNVKAFESLLQRLVAVSAKLQEGGLNPDEFVEARQEIRALGTAVVAARDTLIASSRASDEFARNVARDARQASREQIEAARTARSRFVVEQQAQASAARDSAKRRIAIIQATARTIATIERGLSNIFRQTARVFSSAFRAAGNAVSGVATGIGRAFSRTTTNIRNSVSNSNSEVSRSYRKTFGDATNTVRNESRQQTSVINNFAREATQSLSSIRSGVGLGLGAAVGGILGVGAARALAGGFQRATTLENSERALTRLLDSADKAKTLLTEVTEVVTGTPFRLDQFAAGATQLLAFNVEAEKIPEVLRTISDASALSLDPDQTVDRLIRTFGQISAAGKLTTEDINQLTEAGVPAWALLGNQIGKTTTEMRDLVTEGAVPAEEAIDLLLNGIQNGTDGINGTTVAFAGLSKELGTTLKGSLANFNTAISRLGANIITTFQKPLVTALAAGTAAIDLLGSALKEVAIAIRESLVVQTLQRALEGLARGLKAAKDQAQPLFEFLADGIAIVAQVAAGLFVFRRLPAIFSALARGIALVLSPTNLLIAGLVVAASFFKNLFEGSQDLRDALGRLGGALQRIATVITDLVKDAFGALTTGAETGVDAVGGLADSVLDYVIPALESLTNFLLEQVLPPIRRFARFMRTEVLPFIGENVRKAVDIASSALGTFVSFVGGLLKELVTFFRVAFDIIVRGGTAGGLRLAGDSWLAYNGPIAQGLNNIRNVLLEVVDFFRASATILIRGDEFTDGGDGWLSENGFVIKGLERIRGAMESLVNFIGGNLLPVLASVGAAFGVLSLTGNIPLAGLAGITAGIATALSDKDIRDALVRNIENAIDRTKELWDNFIDSGVLATIGVQVLKVTRKIGEVIGTFVSDPRFIAALGAIVGSAVLLAGSFVVGFLEGIESNLGDLVRGLVKLLSKAFQLAVSAAVEDPAIAAALIGLIAGAAVIRSMRAAAKQTAALTAGQFGESLVANANTAGVGNTSSAFFKSFFGGPQAIQKIGAQSGEVYAKAFATRIRRNNDLIRAVRGTTAPNPLGLQQERDQGRFTNRLAATPTNLRAQEAEIRRLTAAYGTATLAGAQLRRGLQNIRGAFTSAGQGAQQFRDGLAQVGAGLRGAATQIGTTIGTLAGGAFAASFIAQALLDVNSTGQQKLQSGLGLVAVGASTGFQLTGTGQGAAIGAGVGAAAAGLLALTTAFRDNGKAAEAAAKLVADYQDAVAGLTDTEDIANAIRDQFRDALNETDGIQKVLRTVGVRYEDFQAVLNDRQAANAFFDEVETRGRLGGEAADFLRLQYEAVQDALRAESISNDFFSVATENANLAAGAADVATEATGAFRAKVSELNEARLDGFRSRVDEAKTLLDNAGRAADEAKEKLRQFLSGETEEVGFQEQINEAIIGVANIGSGLAGLDLNLIKDKATFDNQVLEVQRQVGSLFANAPEGTDLVALVQPLRDAISQEELTPEVTAALQGGIDAALAQAQSNEGLSLFNEVFNTENLEADAAAQVEATKAALATALEQNPLDIPLILAAATAEFETVGADSAAGWVEGFDSESLATAAQEGADKALAAARTALGISSPSLQFEIIGGFATLGFAKGLGNNLEKVEEAGVKLKEAAIAGIDPEGAGEYLAFLDAGRDSGLAFGDAMGRPQVLGSVSDRGTQLAQAALLGISESGEFLDFLDAGSNAGFAFARGLRNSTSAAASAARAVANAAKNALENELDIDSPSKVFRTLGEQTMEGFALGIADGAQLAADAADAAVTSALDTTVATIGGVTVGVTPSSTAGTASQGITGSNIEALGRAIAAASKPNVNIEQTFTEPVDSRAIAADVAWRLT